MVYRIGADDRAAFKRCRREWDLGSPNRQNLEPRSAPEQVDLGAAVRAALAVYYLPGTWGRGRGAVLRRAHQVLDRSVHAQAARCAGAPPSPALLRLGHEVLDGYAAWAPTVDELTPVQVDTDVEVAVPDPAMPGADLHTPDGETIHYADRVDLLAADDEGGYWVLQHRVLTGDWAGDDELLRDERTLAWCWAVPLRSPGVRVLGTMYNEIHLDERAVRWAEPGAHSLVRHRRTFARRGALPRERIRTDGTDGFRRTRIPRGDAEVAAAVTDLAAEARTATAAGLAIYPTPVPETCGRCRFGPPCLALNEGGDALDEIARGYRRRASPAAADSGSVIPLHRDQR